MIEVVSWISCETAEEYNDAPCGGMGGWFNWNGKGQRWKDYIDVWNEISIPYLEAIRRAVLKNKIRITGDLHQYNSDGVPLFNDGTVATFSFRGWGDLMAAIWSEAEDKDYNYMDFYM